MSNIILAKNAGYCFGVKRAVDGVTKLSEENPGADIFTVGQLIHNKAAVERLASHGIRAVEPEQLPDIIKNASKKTFAVIRTHGVAPEYERRLREAARGKDNIEIADFTCPFVSRLHEIMDTSTSEETFTILFGDPAHPENTGTSGHINGDYIIISDFDGLQEAAKDGFGGKAVGKRVVMAAQTTQNSNEYEKSKNFIKKLYTNALFFDTICGVTENRQAELEKISRECDAVIICGSRESSNSMKLYAISRKNCADTYFIERASDIPAKIKKTSKTIGVAAGASTPAFIIEEVLHIMSEQENFAQLLDASFKTLNTGDTVRGTVLTVSDTEVKVDIGSKVTGIITIENVTDDPQAKLKDLFKPGDEVEAVAVRVSDVDGIATLSIKRFEAQKNTVRFNEALKAGELVEGKVIEAVKGGVIVYALSQKVFVPASLTGVPRDGDLNTLVGTKVKMKLHESEDGKKRTIGSIRDAIREERDRLSVEFWAGIEEGQHFEGTVKSIMSYGVFVDLGSGVDGMVHSSELSWLHVGNPKDFVKVGDKLTVVVKSVDKEAKKISLSHKAEEENPWDVFRSANNVGDVINVTVVSMMPFGAFAQIIPGVDGLIHISQIADKKINHPSDVLKKGEEVTVKITDINDETHKINLSIRALLEDNGENEEASAEETSGTDAE